MSKRYAPTEHTDLAHRTTNDQYLLFAEVKGKLFVKDLDTTEEAVALKRRDAMLSDLRARMGDSVGVATAGKTITIRWLSRRGLTKWRLPPLLYLPAGITLTWQKACAAAFKNLDSRRHKGAGLIRKAFDLVIQNGIRADNPAVNLKRLRETPKRPTLLTLEQFHAIIQHMRASGHMTQFLAYGCYRLNEAKHVLMGRRGREAHDDPCPGRKRAHAGVQGAVGTNECR